MQMNGFVILYQSCLRNRKYIGHFAFKKTHPDKGLSLFVYLPNKYTKPRQCLLSIFSRRASQMNYSAFFEEPKPHRPHSAPYHR